MGKSLLLIGCMYSVLLALVSVTDVMADQHSYWVDRVDEFTDERTLMVVVLVTDIDSDFLYTATLQFLCNFKRKSVSVTLYLNSPWYDAFKTLKTMGILLRFDRKPAFEERWEWIGELSMAGKLLADPLFDEALVSNQLLVKTGYADVVRFDLVNARADMVTFNRRCSTALQRP